MAAFSLAVASANCSTAWATDFSISTVAGTGTTCMPPASCGDGASAALARLNGPAGVAVDASGDVYVADTGDNEIRRISPSGEITTVAGTGVACSDYASTKCGDGGPATAARLRAPRGVAVDSAGKVYVADTGDEAIRMFAVGGDISTIAGGAICPLETGCGDGGPAADATLTSPGGVALDASGRVYVADTGDNEIRRFAVGGNMATIAGTRSACNQAGTGGPTCGDHGPATAAGLNGPAGVTVKDNNVYVADTGDNEIRMFAVGGAIITVAGTGRSCTRPASAPKPTCGDGGSPTSARLTSPAGVAVDRAGNVLIADTGDHEIRGISPGSAISTVAGTGGACARPTSACGDGPATGAHLSSPGGVTMASGGRRYVADSGENKVRLLTPLVPRPPRARINSPSRALVVTQRERRQLNFSCLEGTNGPGLASCRVCELRPHASPPTKCFSPQAVSGGTVRMNSATTGIHVYVVTATSRDGMTGLVRFSYEVRRKRLEVFAPPAFMKEASTPCVMYRCAVNPAPHTNFEQQLVDMQKGWCNAYSGCLQNPMDLWPTNGFDDNLFPFNPDWAYFARIGSVPFPTQLCNGFSTTDPVDWHQPGDQPCTSQQTSTDEGQHGSGLICRYGRDPAGAFHGHVNWEPATYEGDLKWYEESGTFSDNDYSLDLQTFNLDGATGENNGGNAVHIEFDSDETIDHFGSDGFWSDLHTAADGSDAAAAQLVDGHLAEVTGLVGLDTVHSASAELHPVYAIGIQSTQDVSKIYQGGNDYWTFFARNWGNEGYCSHKDHPLPPGPITVRIPWLNGARGVSLQDQPHHATGVQNVSARFDQMNNDHPGIAERVIPGEGILLTFDLSTDPSKEPEYWGTLVLRWSFGRGLGPVGLPVGSPGNRAPTRPVAHPGTESGDIEGMLKKLFGRLTPQARHRARARIPRLMVITHHATRVRVRMRPPPTRPLVSPGAIFVRPPLDRAVVKHGDAVVGALCRAYRNRVPGLPRSLCV